jgi:hypothetical protein
MLHKQGTSPSTTAIESKRTDPTSTRTKAKTVLDPVNRSGLPHSVRLSGMSAARERLVEAKTEDSVIGLFPR